MDAQALAPPREVTRWSFLIATIILGFAGSLIGLSVMATGTYVMGPFLVDLSLKPSTDSSTNLAIAPRINGLNPGHASADTHAGFLRLDATVVDLVRPPRLDLATARARSPLLLAESLKDEARAAQRRFARQAGIGIVAGGAAGGTLMALFGFRPRRIFQGLLAGVLLCGVLAFVMQQSYDVNKFAETTFKTGTVSAFRAPG